MQAIVKEQRAPGLTVKSVPKPAPGPGEVLIAVRHAGVCGTDLHIAEWDHWAEGRLKPPVVIGHEFAGEIAGLGAGVSGLRVGQLVTAEGHIICGHCLQCRTGNGHICRNTRIIGVDRDGAFAEYIVMPTTNVLTLSGIRPRSARSWIRSAMRFTRCSPRTFPAAPFSLWGAARSDVSPWGSRAPPGRRR